MLKRISLKEETDDFPSGLKDFGVMLAAVLWPCVVAWYDAAGTNARGGKLATGKRCLLPERNASYDGKMPLSTGEGRVGGGYTYVCDGMGV